MFIFLSCEKNLETYYSYGSGRTSDGERKEFFTGNQIYLDNTKINEYELFMVYNIMDTIFDGYVFNGKVYFEEEDPKIFVIDTLKFKVDDYGVKSLNNKYLVDSEYDIFTLSKYDVGDNNLLKNIIKVQNGTNIEVILKKDNKIIESYYVDLNYGGKDDNLSISDDNLIDYQYIINPLSKSRFQIDTIQYGGYVFREFKSKKLSKNFIKIKGEKIDFYMTKPPDTITYNKIKIGDSYFGSCDFGCKKSILEQVR
jgi:hypothetical protein